MPFCTLPEAFHNGPRYSGVLAAVGFAALIFLGELASEATAKLSGFCVNVCTASQ